MMCWKLNFLRYNENMHIICNAILHNVWALSMSNINRSNNTCDIIKIYFYCMHFFHYLLTIKYTFQFNWYGCWPYISNKPNLGHLFRDSIQFDWSLIQKNIISSFLQDFNIYFYQIYTYVYNSSLEPVNITKNRCYLHPGFKLSLPHWNNS